MATNLSEFVERAQHSQTIALTDLALDQTTEYWLTLTVGDFGAFADVEVVATPADAAAIEFSGTLRPTWLAAEHEPLTFVALIFDHPLPDSQTIQRSVVLRLDLGGAELTPMLRSMVEHSTIREPDGTRATLMDVLSSEDGTIWVSTHEEPASTSPLSPAWLAAAPTRSGVAFAIRANPPNSGLAALVPLPSSFEAVAHIRRDDFSELELELEYQFPEDVRGSLENVLELGLSELSVRVPLYDFDHPWSRLALRGDLTIAEFVAPVTLHLDLEHALLRVLFDRAQGEAFGGPTALSNVTAAFTAFALDLSTLPIDLDTLPPVALAGLELSLELEPLRVSHFVVQLDASSQPLELANGLISLDPMLKVEIFEPFAARDVRMSLRGPWKLGDTTLDVALFVPGMCVEVSLPSGQSVDTGAVFEHFDVDFGGLELYDLSLSADLAAQDYLLRLHGTGMTLELAGQALTLEHVGLELQLDAGSPATIALFGALVLGQQTVVVRGGYQRGGSWSLAGYYEATRESPTLASLVESIADVELPAGVGDLALRTLACEYRADRATLDLAVADDWAPLGDAVSLHLRWARLHLERTLLEVTAELAGRLWVAGVDLELVGSREPGVGWTLRGLADFTDVAGAPSIIDLLTDAIARVSGAEFPLPDVLADFELESVDASLHASTGGLELACNGRFAWLSDVPITVAFALGGGPTGRQYTLMASPGSGQIDLTAVLDGLLANISPELALPDGLELTELTIAFDDGLRISLAGQAGQLSARVDVWRRDASWHPLIQVAGLELADELPVPGALQQLFERATARWTPIAHAAAPRIGTTPGPIAAGHTLLTLLPFHDTFVGEFLGVDETWIPILVERGAPQLSFRHQLLPSNRVLDLDVVRFTSLLVGFSSPAALDLQLRCDLQTRLGDTELDLRFAGTLALDLTRRRVEFGVGLLGAIDRTSDPAGVVTPWVEPFGFPGLTVASMDLQLGPGTRALRGEFLLQDSDARLEFEAVITVQATGVHVEAERLTLRELLRAFVGVYVSGSLGESGIEALELDYASGPFSFTWPSGIVSRYQPGLSGEAQLDLFGLDMRAVFAFGAEQRSLAARMSPLVIGTLLALEGPTQSLTTPPWATGIKERGGLWPDVFGGAGPWATIDIGAGHDASGRFAARVTVLQSLTEQVQADFDDTGLQLHLTRAVTVAGLRWTPNMTLGFGRDARAPLVSFQGGLETAVRVDPADIARRLGIDAALVSSFDIVDVELALAFDGRLVGKHLSGALDGRFSLWGQAVSFRVGLRANLDLATLARRSRDEIVKAGEAALRFLSDLVGDVLAAVATAVNSVVDAVADLDDEIDEVIDDIAGLADDVAEAFADLTNAIDDLAKDLGRKISGLFSKGKRNARKQRTRRRRQAEEHHRQLEDDKRSREAKLAELEVERELLVLDALENLADAAALHAPTAAAIEARIDAAESTGLNPFTQTPEWDPSATRTRYAQTWGDALERARKRQALRDHYRSALTEAVARLAELDGDVAAARADVVRARQEQANADTQLDELQRELAALENEHRHAQNLVEHANAGAVEAEIGVLTLEHGLEHLQADRVGLEIETNTLERIAAWAQQARDRFVDQRNALLEQLELAHAQLDRGTELVAEAEARLARAEAALVRVREARRTLTLARLDALRRSATRELTGAELFSTWLEACERAGGSARVHLRPLREQALELLRELPGSLLDATQTAHRRVVELDTIALGTGPLATPAETEQPIDKLHELAPDSPLPAYLDAWRIPQAEPFAVVESRLSTLGARASFSPVAAAAWAAAGPAAWTLLAHDRHDASRATITARLASHGELWRAQRDRSNELNDAIGRYEAVKQAAGGDRADEQGPAITRLYNAFIERERAWRSHDKTRLAEQSDWILQRMVSPVLVRALVAALTDAQQRRELIDGGRYPPLPLRLSDAGDGDAGAGVGVERHRDALAHELEHLRAAMSALEPPRDLDSGQLDRLHRWSQTQAEHGRAVAALLAELDRGEATLDGARSALATAWGRGLLTVLSASTLELTSTVEADIAAVLAPLTASVDQARDLYQQGIGDLEAATATLRQQFDAQRDSLDDVIHLVGEIVAVEFAELTGRAARFRRRLDAARMRLDSAAATLDSVSRSLAAQNDRHSRPGEVSALRRLLPTILASRNEGVLHAAVAQSSRLELELDAIERRLAGARADVTAAQAIFESARRDIESAITGGLADARTDVATASAVANQIAGDLRQLLADTIALLAEIRSVQRAYVSSRAVVIGTAVAIAWNGMRAQVEGERMRVFAELAAALGPEPAPVSVAPAVIEQVRQAVTSFLQVDARRARMAGELRDQLVRHRAELAVVDDAARARFTRELSDRAAAARAQLGPAQQMFPSGDPADAPIARTSAQPGTADRRLTDGFTLSLLLERRDTTPQATIFDGQLNLRVRGPMLVVTLALADHEPTTVQARLDDSRTGDRMAGPDPTIARVALVVYPDGALVLWLDALPRAHAQLPDGATLKLNAAELVGEPVAAGDGPRISDVCVFARPLHGREVIRTGTRAADAADVDLVLTRATRAFPEALAPGHQRRPGVPDRALLLSSSAGPRVVRRDLSLEAAEHGHLHVGAGACALLTRADGTPYYSFTDLDADDLPAGFTTVEARHAERERADLRYALEVRDATGDHALLAVESDAFGALTTATSVSDASLFRLASPLFDAASPPGEPNDIASDRIALRSVLSEAPLQLDEHPRCVPAFGLSRRRPTGQAATPISAVELVTYDWLRFGATGPRIFGSPPPTGLTMFATFTATSSGTLLGWGERRYGQPAHRLILLRDRLFLVAGQSTVLAVTEPLVRGVPLRITVSESTVHWSEFPRVRDTPGAVVLAATTDDVLGHLHGLSVVWPDARQKQRFDAGLRVRLGPIADPWHAYPPTPNPGAPLVAERPWSCTGALSFSVWLRAPRSRQGVALRFVGRVPEHRYELAYRDGGLVFRHVGAELAIRDAVATSGWMHVGVAVDPDTTPPRVSLQIDGVVRSQAETRPVVDQLLVHAGSTEVDFDELRVWPRTLSAAEFDNAMLHPVTLSATDQILRWHRGLAPDEGLTAVAHARDRVPGQPVESSAKGLFAERVAERHGRPSFRLGQRDGEQTWWLRWSPDEGPSSTLDRDHACEVAMRLAVVDPPLQSTDQLWYVAYGGPDEPPAALAERFELPPVSAAVAREARRWRAALRDANQRRYRAADEYRAALAQAFAIARRWLAVEGIDIDAPEYGLENGLEDGLGRWQQAIALLERLLASHMTGLSLHGAASQHAVLDMPALDTASGLTWCWWMRGHAGPPSGAVASYLLAGRSEFAVSVRDGRLVVHGSAALEFALPDDADWHHYALTWSVPDQVTKLYIDREPVGTATASAGEPAGGGRLLLGHDGEQQGFVGRLEGFCVWNRALTRTEFAADNEATLAPLSRPDRVACGPWNTTLVRTSWWRSERVAIDLEHPSGAALLPRGVRVQVSEERRRFDAWAKRLARAQETDDPLADLLGVPRPASGAPASNRNRPPRPSAGTDATLLELTEPLTRLGLKTTREAIGWSESVWRATLRTWTPQPAWNLDARRSELARIGLEPRGPDAQPARALLDALLDSDERVTTVERAGWSIAGVAPASIDALEHHDLASWRELGDEKLEHMLRQSGLEPGHDPREDPTLRRALVAHEAAIALGVERPRELDADYARDNLRLTRLLLLGAETADSRRDHE